MPAVSITSIVTEPALASSILTVNTSFIESNIPSSGTIYFHSPVIVEYLTVFMKDNLSSTLKVIFLFAPLPVTLKSKISGGSLSYLTLNTSKVLVLAMLIGLSYLSLAIILKS